MTKIHMFAILLLTLVVGYILGKTTSVKEESFEDLGSSKKCTKCQEDMCGSCGKKVPCGCSNPMPSQLCSGSPTHDMSRYILKSSIPLCPLCPDLSNYILKSEVPPYPDLSKYILKSSIPKQVPVILDCSKCNKPKGECPPCPRSRCPEVICPEPVTCPPYAPCPRTKCPPAIVKCKSEPRHDTQQNVKPFLAPLDFDVFGTG